MADLRSGMLGPRACYHRPPRAERTGGKSDVAHDHGTGDVVGLGEKLAALLQHRGRLSPSQVADLRKVFPEIVKAHHDQVWEWLRRRRLSKEEIEDLVQEVLATLFRKLVDEGFPPNLPGSIHGITYRLFLNHVRGRRRTPASVALPSSGSEKPKSGPDVDRALDLLHLAEQVLPLLRPEHRAVIEAVVLHGLSLTEAASVLDWPEGTAKSRLMAAKAEMLRHAAPLLPPSQRGT